jgi:hypothetical protein
MSIDKLYCYDSMYNDSVTLSSGTSPLTIDLSSIQSVSGNSSINSVTTGASGVYTINNTGTISNGSAYPWLTSVNDTITIGDIPQKTLNVKGDAEIEGELIVGGKNIGDSLDRIEKRLAILRPNADLEERWDRLRELGEEYRKLEKDILGQEEIYNILKK